LLQAWLFFFWHRTSTHAPHNTVVQQHSEVIHTNQRHPFLTLEHGFVPVTQLTLGMQVLNADGTVGTVTGWKVVPGTQVMYHLEVAQDHTSMVGAGQWVVHNCGAKGFLNQNRLLKHFAEHENEWDRPFVSAQQYEDAANRFMSGERPESVIQGRMVSGYFKDDLVRYNTITNEFGMMRADGYIRTFYRPVNGIEEFWKTLMPNGVLDMKP
jgi:hypothetical protein